MIWVQFFLSGAVIVFAAMQLAKYADAIALRTGLGRLFIGTLLLGATTSLPEVLTSISSFNQGVPNLAAGNLIGSNMFNMVLLAVADLASRNARVLRKVAMRHALSGSLTMVMIGLVVLMILADLDIKLGWVGLDSILIMLAFAGGIKLMQDANVGPAVTDEPDEIDAAVPTMLRSAIGFALATGTLIIVSPMLVSSSAEIAVITGLGTSFVGLTLVAVMTSLPELVTTLTLVRIGAEDMAIGNLFGSNMFNAAAVGFMDLFYTQGRFIGVIEPTMALVAMLGLVMTGIALVGNLAKLERRIFSLEIDASLIVLIYIGGLALMYTKGISP